MIPRSTEWKTINRTWKVLDHQKETISGLRRQLALERARGNRGGTVCCNSTPTNDGHNDRGEEDAANPVSVGLPSADRDSRSRNTTSIASHRIASHHPVLPTKGRERHRCRPETTTIVAEQQGGGGLCHVRSLAPVAIGESGYSPTIRI